MAVGAIAVVETAIGYVWAVFLTILNATGMYGIVVAAVVACLATLKLVSPVVGSAGSDSLFYGHAGRLNAPKKGGKK